MPIVSRFFGIIVQIFFNEHNPPHYHVKYGKYKAVVDIKTGIISGKFPKRACKMVKEWHDLHQKELLENWNIAQIRGTIKKIEPLE